MQLAPCLPRTVPDLELAVYLVRQMMVARQLRQLAAFVVTRAEKTRGTVICSNMKRHETPDQTGLIKCWLPRQSPIKESTRSNKFASCSGRIFKNTD